MINSLELLCLDRLRRSKNLLAFSGGTDSSALFFLLLERKIPFDIAIVDYRLRKESAKELAYARKLAKEYNKKIFIKTSPLTPPGIEQKARTIRYRFFEEIIEKEGYNNLITAHQLNDQFEWFLMQFAKGAGVVELVGMEPCTSQEHYTIVRPLLFVSRQEILSYLKEQNIKYFTDHTNYDESFARNFIRHNFSDPFLERFASGAKRSLRYLLEDKRLLEAKISTLQDIVYARKSSDSYQNMRIIDKIFKKLGYLLTAAQKKEIVRQKEGVVGGKFAFAITDHLIIAAPYISTTIPKKVRDHYRKHKIPKVLRGYLFTHHISPTLLDKLPQKSEAQSPWGLSQK